MKAIFIDCNHQLEPVWHRVHRPDDPAVTLNTAPFTSTDLPRLLDGYEVVLDDHSAMPTQMISQCKALKHIVFLGTGAASYMNLAELKDLGITVHIIKGYGDTAVAEHTIALLLACARDIARMDRTLRGGTWKPLEGVQLLGKTIGIIGLGGIGSETARIAQGLGMNVIAYNRTARPESGVMQVGLDELLERSDVVSLSLVLNDETRNFLDATRLARMKPGAIFLNTARAALVDEAALVAGLATGPVRPAGRAGLPTAPLAGSHPLTRMHNVTLSAHSAFRTPEASETLLRRALDIVKSL